MNIPDDLIRDMQRRRVLLFVGAGVSMNLALPSWSSLIDHIAEDLEFDASEFKKLGNFLELAEYYKLKRGSIGPLRSWMDTNFHSPAIEIRDSEVHRLIVELEFPLIYTTNYDRWLEKAFDAYGKPYDKITQILDFTQTHDDRTQIIKYHGDFDDDNSIVLTETSYFERLSLDKPLDMKLRADSLGRSLLFIGYSLSDIDVRYLLYKLQKLWSGSLEASMRPKSYIFLTQSNPVQRAVLDYRGVESIVCDIDDPGKALAHFLDELKEAVN